MVKQSTTQIWWLNGIFKTLSDTEYKKAAS